VINENGRSVGGDGLMKFFQFLVDYKGREMNENERVVSPGVVRVALGEALPATALALLWGRGDEPDEIAARFRISLATVEEAIRWHGHNYPRRPKRRRRRT
jgi:hypothetical protein